MKKNIFNTLIFLALLFYCKDISKNSDLDNNNQESKNIKYKINVASKLIIRDKPNISASKLGIINECDLVKFISEDKELIKIDNIESSFNKIETLDGIVGYAYGGYLWDTNENPNSTFYTDRYIQNREPFNILGKWIAFPHEEYKTNTYFIFYKDKVVIDYYFPPAENSDWNSAVDDFHEYAVGTYSYDGCCEILVPLMSGRIDRFRVVKYKGAITLMINCYIFDPNLKIELSDIE
jgi:hypothetical protein